MVLQTKKLWLGNIYKELSLGDDNGQSNKLRKSDGRSLSLLWLNKQNSMEVEWWHQDFHLVRAKSSDLSSRIVSCNNNKGSPVAMIQPHLDELLHLRNTYAWTPHKSGCPLNKRQDVFVQLLLTLHFWISHYDLNEVSILIIYKIHFSYYTIF